MSQAEQPLISHLIELRTRLLHAISAILLVFVCLVYFSNNIYDFVAQPLLSQLPAGTSMIATDVATPLPDTHQADSGGLLLCGDPLSALPGLGLHRPWFVQA